MIIELLYFDGCPSWRKALDQIRIAVPDADIRLIQIANDQEAARQHFTGSPMIRVEGRDLFPVDHSNYSLSCRLYQVPNGLLGWPLASMISGALAGSDEGVSA